MLSQLGHCTYTYTCMYDYDYDKSSSRLKVSWECCLQSVLLSK